MKTIKFIFLLSGLLCYLPALKAQTIREKADSLLTAYHRQDLFTGTVLIVKSGRIAYEKSYGLANREKGIPNTSNTEYRIGSLSKPITALIIMQLREKGLLRLHDPLSKYVSGFSKGDSVTIAHLLNHTSGIRSLTSTNRYRTDRRGIKGREDVLEILTAEPFEFSPGSKWQYSNSNYMLLSYIAEKVSGRPMAQLVKEFGRKLGMKNTGMDDESRKSSAQAVGYEAGTLQDFLPVADQDISLITGAGGIYSTASDLYRLDRALSKGAVLSKTALEEMFSPGKGNYGYGWETGQYLGRNELGHSGSIEGFKSMILRYPESGTCIIFLSNYWNTRGPEICENLKAITFDQPYHLPASRSFISLSPAQLSDYEGEYTFKGAMRMVINAESGHLLSTIKGQPVVSFKPLSDSEFYNKSNNALIRFEKDQTGSYIRFKLLRGKQEMEWLRSQKTE